MVILFDQFHLPESIYEIIFATEQQMIVGKLLIGELKRNNGLLGKTEMSLFANNLHGGTVVEIEDTAGQKKEVQISYNKRQFYDRILTPMKTMGMIDYDMYKKKYMISDKFNSSVQKIGLMWVQEVAKPLKNV